MLQPQTFLTHTTHLTQLVDSDSEKKHNKYPCPEVSSVQPAQHSRARLPFAFAASVCVRQGPPWAGPAWAGPAHTRLRRCCKRDRRAFPLRSARDSSTSLRSWVSFNPASATHQLCDLSAGHRCEPVPSGGKWKGDPTRQSPCSARACNRCGGTPPPSWDPTRGPRCSEQGQGQPRCRAGQGRHGPAGSSRHRSPGRTSSAGCHSVPRRPHASSFLGGQVAAAGGVTGPSRERTRTWPSSGPASLSPCPAWRGVSRTRPLPGAELVASALCLERGWSHLPQLGSLPNSVWWPGLNVSSGWGLSAATVYRGRTHVPVASGELFGGSPRPPGGQVGWRHVGQGRGCVSG